MTATLATTTSVPSESSESSERSRRALHGSAALAAASAMSFLTSLALVPLTIGYLGVERFGVLVTVVAVASLCEPLDLGIGSALVTLLAREGSSSLSGTGAMLTRVALRWMWMLASVCVAMLTFVAWRWPLGDMVQVSGDVRHVIAPTIVVVAVAFALGLPLGLVDKVNLGLQQAVRVGTTTVAGQALALALVALAAWRRCDVPLLAAAMMAGPLLARAIAGALLWRDRRDARTAGQPLVVGAPGAVRGALLHTAPLYFGLQLAVAVAFTSDQFVVARVLGADDAARYAVPARVFALVTTAAAVLVRPLWPAFAAAAAAGDRAWVVRTARRSIGTTALAASGIGAALVLAGPRVLSVLGRGELATSRHTLAVFALWSVLAAVGTAVAAVLNGLAIVRIQLILSFAMAASNLGLSIVLARRIGLTGVLWGSVVSYVVFVALPYLVLLPRLIDRALDQRHTAADAWRSNAP